jgi:LuxR family transcriptional regulator, maltose regulon positive regulatory protein
METVSYLSNVRRSPAPTGTASAMIKVYTLGPFSLLVDGKPLRFARKAKSKPLELLKALIAHGGRDVRQDSLAAALWPDSDADLAAYSLTSTLHRLRMLVGPSTIQRQAGRLSVDTSRCWVDAWSFERKLTLLERAHRSQELDATLDLAASLVLQYRGPFLAGDADHAWVLCARERIQGRLLNLLDSIGTALALARRYEQAFAWFKRAVEINPLAEGPYRSLMQLNLEQGRHADVLLTYQHCRNVLAAGLGCAPSMETEALLRKVRGG